MANSDDVIVVGGGVIGLFSAYYLQRAGRSVRLLEAVKVGAGASTGNCGLISPSHAPPLTQPAVLFKSLRWMMQPSSPFYIHPRTGLREWTWFLRFAVQSLTPARRQAELARAALLQRSRRLYGELVGGDLASVEWEPRGALFVFKDPRGFAAGESTAKALRDSGIRVDSLSTEAAVAMEPTLREDIAGAYFYPDDAHLRPERLLDALRAAVLAAGGVIEEGRGVRAVEDRGSHVAITMTDGETLSADQALIATGALTSRLLTAARCSKRILPGKGYSITMPRPEVCPQIPLAFQETKTVITPFASGYRIGSTMEFRGFDDSLNAVRLDALRRGIVPYIRPPLPPEGGHSWCGWRPMTHDGVPIISALRDSPRIVLAAGHNMLGVSMAPATGELAAALITKGESPLDPAPYRAN